MHDTFSSQPSGRRPSRRRQILTAIACATLAVGCGTEQGDLGFTAPVSIPQDPGPPPQPGPVTVIPPATLQTSAARAYTVGSLGGPLGSLVQQALLNDSSYDGLSTDGIIVLEAAPTGVAATGTGASFDANQPIVMVEPSVQDVNRLLTALGQPPTYTLPAGLGPGVTGPEFFAIDRESNGDLFFLESYPPNPLESTEPGVLRVDPDGPTVRTSHLVDWLNQDGHRPHSASAEATSSNNLVNLARAHVTTQILYLGPIFVQASHYVYACHSFNPSDGADYDWFYIQEACVTNYSRAYERTERFYQQPRTGAGPVAETFFTESTMRNQDNGLGLLTMLRSSPENANGLVRVTSAVNFNFSGKVGFNAAQGLLGDVGLGVGISNSQSFDVQDVQVFNDSQSRFTNAAWAYTFKRMYGVPYFFHAGLSEPVPLSLGNFQPVNQWLWRVAPALRESPDGAGFTTRVKVAHVHSNGGQPRPSWASGPAEHGVADYIWDLPIPLRYPPILYSPRNLSYTAAAGFQPVEVSVSRAWKVTSDQPWCTVSPSTGTGEQTRANVTAEANTTGEDRFATLTFETLDGQARSETRVFQSRF